MIEAATPLSLVEPEVIDAPQFHADVPKFGHALAIFKGLGLLAMEAA